MDYNTVTTVLGKKKREQNEIERTGLVEGFRKLLYTRR